ncbi:Protein of unknown function [Pyronema omphalodes CBS 100304]|uniref:Uncharacterized protein n=1 Tax=Pyronema omphalodes (strain CBS 100304) TaxID=1076935 RepID=U4L4Q0_PYROM|nr:Protein of unknown function [Pyronema omphalodes CBS 100304]
MASTLGNVWRYRKEIGGANSLSASARSTPSLKRVLSEKAERQPPSSSSREASKLAFGMKSVYISAAHGKPDT